MSSAGDRHVEETTSLPVRVTPGQIVYRDRLQTVQRVAAEFAGFTKEYLVSDRGRRAGLVAVRGGDVLLVRQYRLLINAVSFEVPGGRVDEQESFEQAAIRECREETGVECRDLRPLVAFHQGLDTLKNYTRVFYTDATEDVSTVPPDGFVWMPLDRCIEMIYRGEIQDSLSIIALFAYRVRRGAGG